MPHLVWTWEAFSRLGTDRQLGMSVGPIPQSCIYDFCDRHDLTDYNEREEFVALIYFLDRTYLDWVREQQKTTPNAQ